MAKRKKKASDPVQSSFLENYGNTAPAVPAIRQAVHAWRESDYKGATGVTRALLNHWFRTDHKLPNGKPFAYYEAQREALESIIYAFEIAKTRSLKSLYETFIPAEQADKIRLPQHDPFARYATKMATGSGKTKVMSLAIAWQYFNAVIGQNPDYARTFLVIAPNVIVFERLSTDFIGGAMFKKDPVIPRSYRLYWDMQFYVRGDSERASSQGAVYVTNIHQLYESRERDNSDEPDIMTTMLGAKPPSSLNEEVSFKDRIIERGNGPVMVLNDEAHHTHDPDNEWNRAIRAIDDDHPRGLAAQLDFSATPRYDSGQLFAWTISDYTLKQAIVDRLVKRPVKGVTDMGEVPSKTPSVRYEPYITAGVNRWREYREQLKPMGKTPLLFIMMNDTREADSIGDYLRTKYPDEFGNDKTLIIHVSAGGRTKGQIKKNDLPMARKAAREVDQDTSPVNAIVSVLMLREGWDVKNVTVIVGLRPYTSKAQILPEQTIGRGLRLMFRDVQTAYHERVDIIGNPGFIKFIEELEREEDIKFDEWDVDKETLSIDVIEPDPDKAEHDITMPLLSPILARSKSIADEIDSVDVSEMKVAPLPRKPNTAEEKTFRYEGMDILTLEKLVEREYTIPTPQTSQEIVSYYAQIIAQDLNLPSQFAVLAPKVRDFLKYRAFGEEVDLDDDVILQAISRRLTLVVTRKEFTRVLAPRLIHEQEPRLESAGRLLSGIEPFPWSRDVATCRKTILNKVPCDNNFELEFAKFLDRVADVASFSKLPINFGFMIPYTDNYSNLRYYYPDFVVVDSVGVHYLVETKGREDTNVANKDRAATMWAESATQLTGTQWHYVKVLQKDFNELAPSDFADCAYMSSGQGNMFDGDDF